jgi:flagellar biogenesis protein FliO
VLDRFAGSDVPQFMLAAVCLGAVLLLIAAVGWLVRRMPSLLPPAPGTAGPGMALRGTLRLDAHLRLHLVEVGGQQALVLTGGVTDVIVRLSPAES